MIEVFHLKRIHFKTLTNFEEHLDLFDDVNIIDAEGWFSKQEPSVNFEILFLLELLVILSRELVHVFLSWRVRVV